MQTKLRQHNKVIFVAWNIHIRSSLFLQTLMILQMFSLFLCTSFPAWTTPPSPDLWPGQPCRHLWALSASSWCGCGSWGGHSHKWLGCRWRWHWLRLPCQISSPLSQWVAWHAQLEKYKYHSKRCETSVTYEDCLKGLEWHTWVGYFNFRLSFRLAADNFLSF